MTNWQRIQDDFLINKNHIYLNNCGISSPPKQVVQKTKDFLDDFSSYSVTSQNYSYQKTRENIKGILAKLLHCKNKNLALMHTTSEAMLFLAQGLNLKKGDKVVLIENEYPSNVYPWMALQNQGVEILFLQLDFNKEKLLENFAKLLKQNVKVVSMSAVHWLSGFILPLQEMGQLCQEANIFFAVDGAQGVGHVEINPTKCNIDFMAFSAWKWLQGPTGLAAVYINLDKLPLIEPFFASTGSVVDDENYFPYRKIWKEDAEIFNYSTPSFLDWIYFENSLSYQDEIGFQKIQHRIYELANYVASKLTQEDFIVLHNDFSENSGIVSFKHPTHKSSDLFQQLTEHNITASLRNGFIRLSPHILNSTSQLDRVVEI